MTTRAATGFCIALLAAAWCAPCAAQGTVYESKDKAGPVFSDQPSKGAKPVELAPPNVIETPRTPAARPAPAAAAPKYSSLAIASLANEDTVHTNTGDFDLRVRSVPALRAAAGDRYRVTIDGNPLPTTYASTKLRISAADWQAAAGGDEKHTLRVAIVGPSGAISIESAPVSFYARRATVRKEEEKEEAKPHRRR
jgi:hypothetical protein